MSRGTTMLVVALVCATAIAVAVIVTQDTATPAPAAAEPAPVPTTVPTLTTLPLLTISDDPATDHCETLLATADRTSARGDAYEAAAEAGAASRDLYDMTVRHHAMGLLDLDAVMSECGPDVVEVARAVRQLAQDVFAEVRAVCVEAGHDFC